MTPGIIKTEIRWVATVALAVLLFASGWVVNGWRKDADLADLRIGQSQEKRQIAEQALARIAQANARSDDLVAQLTKAEQSRDQLIQEKNHAVLRLTSGRPCFDRDAVRVLNSAILPSSPGGLPETTGQPVSDDAPFATDTDVGLWVVRCQSGYDTCRARLDAIADFYKDE